MWCISARAAFGVAVAVAWAALPAMGASPAAGAEPDANPVAAVWKERRIEFVYPGLTARYSCDGLRDKVRAMLIDLGARHDVKIVATGCDAVDRSPVDSAHPTLSIVFSAPALPDPAAKPLRVGDLAAIDARFEAFTITTDAFRNMGIGDCELVQEFARQILPRLATVNVRRDITCAPIQQSGSRFLVRGRILKVSQAAWTPGRLSGPDGHPGHPSGRP